MINNPRFSDSQFSYGMQFEGFNTGEGIRCNECGSYLTNLKWQPPYQVKLSKIFLGDFIYGPFARFIVSKNFKDKYLKSELIGLYDFCEVNLFYKKNLLIKEIYYYPQIILSEARIDIKKSGMKFEGDRTCNLCQRAGRPIKDMKGIIFESPNNIKEDVFDTKVIGGVIVSERFKEFIDENNFTNIALQNASTYIPSFIRSRFT